MADAALGVAMEALLKTVLSLVAEEITVAWSLDKELTKLAQKLEMVQALLFDAQSKQVNNKAVQLWLKRLQLAALDAQIVLEEFGYQVLRQKIESRKRDKVRRLFSSSNLVSFRPKFAHKVKDVMSSVEEVYAESGQIGLRPVEFISSIPDLKEKRLTDPFVEDSEIVGRDDDTSQVINMLTSSDYHEKNLPVITILGMGGQGKTTLAQLVYKDAKVESYFNKRVWVCVSDDFNVQRLLAEMLQSLTQNNSQLTNTEALVSRLKEELSGKSYLLVLDDVWNKSRDQWDHMRRCLLQIGNSKGSKVLATTRSEDVALAMGTSGYHRLRVLSQEQSWELFEKRAFAESGATKKPEMVDIGKRILERCGGVPLAIRAMGGLLYSKHSESEWLMIEKSGVWSDFSDEGNRVLLVIKLSYNHLPSLSLKQCFANCAIFEKGTWMRKDMLIQLWMAQGLLNPPKGSDLQMEDIGSEYFNILLRSSLLQDAQKDNLNNIVTCKMHDLVHDVSLQVSEDYCFHVKDWKQVRNKIEAVHLSITTGEREMWKRLKGIVPSKLRTLRLKGHNLLEEDLSAHFKCLSVLIVEDGEAEELPNWISKMQHLRFVDITTCHQIRKLPKSLTELYYLQTLRGAGLDEVPKGFSQKLINLRHFQVVDMDCWGNFLLPGISQLTNLQTLPFFKVDKCNGCQIEELEHLDNNLIGKLRIFGLENVRSYESALKANLSKKSNIQSLVLNWKKAREEDCDDSDVMDGLKPHSNIKSLEIKGYQSSKIPSWMMRVARIDLNQLRNLVKLTLQGLNKCEGLPSLGDLPCLNFLLIESLHKVKYIGEEFYGYGYGWSNPNPNPNVVDCGVRKNSCCGGADAITLFPALKILVLKDMRSVVEWSDVIIPTPPQSSSVIVKIFPKLEEMIIWDLPMLRAFPNLGCLPSLRDLVIGYCQSLTLSLNWNWVVGSPSDIHYHQSLRHLVVENCGVFTSAFCSLKILAPLESSAIFDNPSLWPKDLHHLTNLRELDLRGHPSYSSEVDCFPFFPHSVSYVTNAPSSPPFDHLQYFPSLTSLSLYGHRLPKVTSLSDQFQYITTLRDLVIAYFHLLEILPEWLGNLTSLQNLNVRSCKNLKQLPSTEAFQRLTNLQHLQIYNCPLLKERCTEGSGSEWPKIAHIPNLELREW